MTELPRWNLLTFIDCSHNSLKFLPLWPNVKNVICSHNKIENLPSWPTIITINCYGNKMFKLPLWPNIQEVTCNINKLKYIPSRDGPVPGWNDIKFISMFEINRKFIIKRYLFNYFIKINRVNRWIKNCINIHELKWRNINAEIICRPKTGIIWEQYINEINNHQPK